MAIRSRLVSVTTSATPLTGAAIESGSAATIYNDGSVTVYVGGPTVTTSGATKGIPLDPGASMDVAGDVDQAGIGDQLCGRVATGTCDVIVLEVGVV